MLRPHAAGEGHAFAAGALLGIANLTLHVMRPWPLKWIVDGIEGKHPHGLPAMLGPAALSAASSCCSTTI